MSNKVVCGGCGVDEVFLRAKGSATGMYCKGCGKWHKWVGKKDIAKLRHLGLVVHPENYIPTDIPKPTPTVTPEMIAQGFGIQSEDANLDNKFYDSMMEEDDEDLYISKSENDYDEDSEKHNPDCPVCLTGVIEPISKSDNYIINIFDKIMFLRTKDNSELFASFKISRCPECGRKL